MDRCISGVKSLIEHQVRCGEVCNSGKAFSEFQKVYLWTNEYIAAYLKLVDFNDKEKALSVMASGDHVFNLITEGIYNIDTFDTNRLTEYFVIGFKRAMILKYDYFTFISKMGNICYMSILEVNELILDILPYMDRECANYWINVIDFNFKIQKEYGTNLNLFRMITLANNMGDMNIYNNYLKDYDSYEMLRCRWEKLILVLSVVMRLI